MLSSASMERDQGEKIRMRMDPRIKGPYLRVMNLLGGRLPLIGIYYLQDSEAPSIVGVEFSGLNPHQLDSLKRSLSEQEYPDIAIQSKIDPANSLNCGFSIGLMPPNSLHK